MLFDLPIEIQASIFVLSGQRHDHEGFAAVRLCSRRHRDAADAAVHHMLAALRSAVEAYSTAQHRRVRTKASTFPLQSTTSFT